MKKFGLLTALWLLFLTANSAFAASIANKSCSSAARSSVVAWKDYFRDQCAATHASYIEIEKLIAEFSREASTEFRELSTQCGGACIVRLLKGATNPTTCKKATLKRAQTAVKKFRLRTSQLNAWEGNAIFSFDWLGVECVGYVTSQQIVDQYDMFCSSGV